jgi:tetratricopeptide (TPR) repeat protein
MARAIVSALKTNDSRPEKPQARSLAAYNLYLDGTYQMKRGGERRLAYAREFFERAIVADPDFGPPYARLAAVYTRLIGWDIVPAIDGLDQAQTAAEAALEAQDLSDAHAELAVIDALRWRWPAANQEFAIALRADPASSELHEAYAVAYLLPMRRFDDALKELRKAQVSDPLAPGILVNEALVHYCRHDYDDAIDECQKALAVQLCLNKASFGLASALAQEGRTSEARGTLEGVKSPNDDAMMASLSGYLAGRSGDTRDARAALVYLDQISKRKPVPSYYRSLIYLGMGNADQTIRYLERAYEEHDPSLIFLAVSPKWDRLRSHPQFVALLKKIGLPQASSYPGN